MTTWANELETSFELNSYLDHSLIHSTCSLTVVDSPQIVVSFKVKRGKNKHDL